MPSNRIIVHTEPVTEQEYCDLIENWDAGDDDSDEEQIRIEVTDANNNNDEQQWSEELDSDDESYENHCIQLFATRKAKAQIKVNTLADPQSTRRITRSVSNPAASVTNSEEPTQCVDEIFKPIYCHTPKAQIEWVQSQNFVRRNTTYDHPIQSVKQIKTPYAYFSEYLSPEFFENVAHYTNIYSYQTESTSFKTVTEKEVEIVFAFHIMMGCLKFPRLSLFWSNSLGLPFFYQHMSRNRFSAIRNHLHLVDNRLRPDDCVDKLFKVRPIIEAVRQRCLQHELEENLCIDEQIIPFKGRLSFKQYIKGKPCPWGLKVYALCGKSGMPYDFFVYQGLSSRSNSISNTNRTKNISNCFQVHLLS